MSGTDEQTLIAGGEQITASIGPYRLLSRLGAGGMGEVYKGQGPDGKTVAIKLVRKSALSAMPGLEERFHREAMVSANIDHPAVVKAYDVGESPHGLYMVMDYAEGQGLDKRIAEGPIAPKDALEIAAQIAEALEVAHGMYVVHRDIKPANVIIEPSGRVRLLDFGIARLGANVQNLTRTGQLIGTPAYMSPEQLHGEAKEADYRVDIWAVGVVLYEMLTGVQPFVGANVFQLIDAITSSEAPVPSRSRSGVPTAVDRVVRKAMARHPDQRHESAGGLANELREIAAGLVDGTPRRGGGDSARGERQGAQAGSARRRDEPGVDSRGRGARPGRRDSRVQSGTHGARPKAAAGLPLPWIVVGGSLVVASVVVAAMMATGPGPAPVAPVPVVGKSTSVPSPPPVIPSPPPDESIQAAMSRLERDRDGTPTALVARVAAWRALEAKAGEGGEAERIATGLLGAEQQLERAARAAFERIKARADELAEAGRHDDARNAWSGFEPAFETDGWRERIHDERRAIEDSRRAAGSTANTPPDLTPATARPPMAGAAWTQVDIATGLAACHPNGATWSASGGVYTLVSTAGGDPAHGLFLHRSSGGVRTLCEFYFAYDFAVARGGMEMRVLQDLNAVGALASCALEVDRRSSNWLELGRWHRMHVRFEGGMFRYKVDGARPGDAEFDAVDGIPSRKGGLLLGTMRGDSEVRVRPIALWVGVTGDPIQGLR